LTEPEIFPDLGVVKSSSPSELHPIRSAVSTNAESKILNFIGIIDKYDEYKVTLFSKSRLDRLKAIKREGICHLI
jgi:hypothetical protein